MAILNRLLAAAARSVAARFLTDDTELVSAGIIYYRKRVNLAPASLRVLELALIAGEDRRYHSHQGVDIRALIRAAVSTWIKDVRQGGSTIEQQLVRTIRRRHEYSLRRKFTEICVSCAVSSRFSKEDLVKAYLAVAYFGYGSNGIASVLKRHGYWHGFSEGLTLGEAAHIVAMLRYPLPRYPTDVRLEQVEQRRKRILHSMGVT